MTDSLAPWPPLPDAWKDTYATLHMWTQVVGKIRLARAAADLEDKTEKHPVTPGPVIPARELLAEMLLEEGKTAEAKAEAGRVLKVSPGRRNALRLAANEARSDR